MIARTIRFSTAGPAISMAIVALSLFGLIGRVTTELLAIALFVAALRQSKRVGVSVTQENLPVFAPLVIFVLYIILSEIFPPYSPAAFYLAIVLMFYASDLPHLAQAQGKSTWAMLLLLLVSDIAILASFARLQIDNLTMISLFSSNRLALRIHCFVLPGIVQTPDTVVSKS